MPKPIDPRVPARHRKFHALPPLPPAPDEYIDEAHRATVIAIRRVGASRLAKVLGVSGPMIRQIVRGMRRLPPQHCEAVWRATEIHPATLRPDYHWCEADDGHWYYRLDPHYVRPSREESESGPED